MEPVVLEQPASSADGPLHRKFGGAEAPLAGEPVVYEFTNDPGLLHQYYQLRLRMFRRTLGGAAFGEEPDKHDCMGYTLIARKGRLCIGGVELAVREPGEKWLLPSEGKSFVFKDKFPHFHLDWYRQAEIFRFAVLEDYNTKEVLYQMCVIMNNWVKERDIKYVFSRSPLTARARLWRKVTNVLGDYCCEIYGDLNAPPLFEGYEGQMYIMAGVAAGLMAGGERVPVISADLIEADMQKTEA